MNGVVNTNLVNYIAKRKQTLSGKRGADAIEQELKELKKTFRSLESQYGELIDKCDTNPQVCKKVATFVNARMINDPLVLNALNPNGINKKQQQELYNLAVESIKDKENRVHPFSQGELKEQLESMERQEELMRRNTRGKSIRMSSASLSELRSEDKSSSKEGMMGMDDDQKACCIIM